MLQYLPRWMKALLRSQLARLTTSPHLPFSTAFLPYQRTHDAYLLPKSQRQPGAPLAVPPQGLWAGYGQDAESYLASGQRHVTALLHLLEQQGMPLQPGEPVLDFGCAAGRMLRWFAPYATAAELWGVDLSAEHIVWCEHALNPPFNFAVTTTTPHLPFEDNSFGLIYSGSVFTHIDDLAKTWLLELRRVLRPGGRLYITLHDKHSLAILTQRQPNYWLTRLVTGHPAYRRIQGSDFAMFTVGRSLAAQVFYDIGYFKQLASSLFKVASVTPEAYGYQTAVLLQKYRPNA